MQIKCNVDQKQAILRGIDSHSSVQLQVDPAVLTVPQREALAARITDGSFAAVIPQPDYDGLIETLDAIIRREADEKERQKKECERMAELALQAARGVFKERLVAHYETRYEYYDAVDGAVRTGAEGVADSPTRGSATWSEIAPRVPYVTSATVGIVKDELARLMALPEGVAWADALREENEAARKVAQDRAKACHLEMVRKLDEAAARESFLNSIVKDNCDAVQLERVKRGYLSVFDAALPFLRERIANALDLPISEYCSADSYCEVEAVSYRGMRVIIAYEDANKALSPACAIYKRKHRDSGDFSYELDVTCKFTGGVKVTQSFCLPAED